MTTLPWLEQAACRNHPPDLFIPERATPRLTQLAKTICNECPVQTDCLNYALQLQLHGDLQGIFGGLTTRERRKLLNITPQPPKKRPQRHGTLYSYRKLKCRCTQCRTIHTQTITRQRQTRRNAPRHISDTPNP